MEYIQIVGIPAIKSMQGKRKIQSCAFDFSIRLSVSIKTVKPVMLGGFFVINAFEITSYER